MHSEHLRTALGLSAAAVLVACSSPSSSATSPSSDKTVVQASEDVASVSANELSTNVADYQQAEVDTRIGGNFGPGFGPMLGMLGGLPGPGAGGGLGGGGGLFGGAGGFGWGWGVGGGWGAKATVNGSCPVDSVGFVITFPPSDPVDTVAYARTWQYFSTAGCESKYVADSTDSVASTYAFLGVMADDSSAWSGRHQGSSADALTGTQEPGTDSVLSTASTHVWNGTAATADSVIFSDTSQARHQHWLAYDTTTNVTFPNPRHGDFFPVSGTWTRWLTDSLAVTGDTTFTKDVALHLVLTFAATSSGQGSQDATLQVYNASTGALVKTCTVDLRWGRTPPNSCH